jgi:hypothetical protein
MNSVRSLHATGLNRAGTAADFEAAAETADTFASIASMLEKVRDFAERALKAEVDGGRHQDEANGVLDAIGDARGAALQAESKVSGW